MHIVDKLLSDHAETRRYRLRGAVLLLGAVAILGGAMVWGDDAMTFVETGIDSIQEMPLGGEPEQDGLQTGP